MKKKNFLHIFGPDTKNSYGIMSQLYKHCDLEQHHFLIAAYESCKVRFPKLEEFPGLRFVPEHCGRLKRMVYFYKQLQQADVIIWHSLFFTTQKYTYFLYFFRKFLKKSVWIEWGADLYSWEYAPTGWRNRLKNHVARIVRQQFSVVGCCFPVDETEVKRQFGEHVQCFYTPLANPMKEADGLIQMIESTRPMEEQREGKPLMVQIGHNSFQFNNHIRMIEHLKRFNQEGVRFVIPLSYGIYGINGQYGGVPYRDAVVDYARQELDNPIIILKNIPFERYIRFLWNIDVAVFDFERPCGLGTLRMLLLMGKKVFLPAGSPYYEYLVQQGMPICDTRKIPEMTYEEFAAPVEYKTQEWVRSYMNNDEVIGYWKKLFAYFDEK